MLASREQAHLIYGFLVLLGSAVLYIVRSSRIGASFQARRPRYEVCPLTDVCEYYQVGQS